MMSSQDALGVTVAVSAALAAVLVAAVVALAPPAARPARGAPPSPTCQEWTDGCVVCARTPEGPACSTPGIACTRGPAKCLKP